MKRFWYWLDDNWYWMLIVGLIGGWGYMMYWLLVFGSIGPEKQQELGLIMRLAGPKTKALYQEYSADNKIAMWEFDRIKQQFYIEDAVRKGE
jgi:hypothetical protein